MRSRPATLKIAFVAVLVVAIALGLFCPPRAACGETEIIRGTVEKFRPGALSLLDVTFGDGDDAGTPIVLIVNDNTEYFDGALRTTKESMGPGLRVLVRCEPAGPGRLAVLIRIIGGRPREQAPGAP